MALTKIDDRGLKTPIDLLDNEKIRLGTGNDIEFYHDGSNSKIVHSGTGGLYIGADTFGLQNGTTDENYIVMSDNGSVDIYHDNVKVFNTDANGIMVKGPEGGTANIYIYADEGDDNDDKFQLTVDNGGPFHIQNRGSGSVETNIKCYGNGAVELYHANSKKLQTYSNGVEITGSYLFHGDGVETRWGGGSDLRIYHSGSESHIADEGTGGLIISGSYVHFKNQARDETFATMTVNGSCELYYDNSKKLETKSYGVQVSGNIYSTGSLELTTDTAKILMGGANDLQIYHDGAHNHIRHGVANQNLYIEGVDNEGGTPFIYLNPRRNQTGLSVKANQGVYLYYDNAKKLSTTSSGLYIGNAAVNSALPVGTNHAGFAFTTDQFYTSTTGTSNNAQVRFYNGNGLVGTITTNGSATGYNTSSDYRLKENEVAISDGITRLKTLKPYRFNFKTEPSKTVDGFFAHEVTPAVPEAITGEKDGTEMQAIDQSKLVPLLTAALQEAITKIETLETKVAALEA